jgi:3-hydroxybutyryl-CoA dehydratase
MRGCNLALWRQRPCPVPLLAGMISDLLGTRLPGRGTNWLKQQLSYPAVAAVGEGVTAVVTITRLRPEKDLVNLRTTCTNQVGTVVCEGEALVYVRDLETSESEAREP